MRLFTERKCCAMNSFDKLLAHLEKSIAKGKAAADYIKKIDEKLYTRHSFPLPQFGKVASNPVEQANFGLLGIWHVAPFKILVEIWYYIQQIFNDRRDKANARKESLTQHAEERHDENLRTFGQWEVLADD